MRGISDCRCQLRGDRLCHLKPGADHLKVARTPAIKRQASQRTENIGHFLQCVAKERSQVWTLCKERDGIQAFVDSLRIAERVAKALREQTCAGRRARSIDRCEQATGVLRAAHAVLDHQLVL